MFTGSLKSSLLTAGAVLSFGLLSSVLAQSTSNIPGRLEAESYKAGGEGVGYHDLSLGNTGGQYRNDNVDVEATADVGGGYNVGWIEDGEWLAYNVNISTATPINHVVARVASGYPTPKTIDVLVDGSLKATLSFIGSATNPVWPACWQNWTDAVYVPFHFGSLSVPAGSHEMKLVFHGNGFNLNYIDFNTKATLLFSSTIGSTTRLEAEDYTNSLDSTVGNDLGKYRADGVDIENCTDIGGGFDVGWVSAGDVLRYRVSMWNAGIYTCTARIGSGWGGEKKFSVYTTGMTTLSIQEALPTLNTINGWEFSTYQNAGWQQFGNIQGISNQVNTSAPISTIYEAAITPGFKEIYVIARTSGFNINYLDFNLVRLFSFPSY